ncbi:hypothetical protein [Sphingomonas sp.]|uniref:hypothetical protein n=1 Tax=Sphingomonas sp. TaxID=28214 RepID=UPI003B3A0ACD
MARALKVYRTPIGFHDAYVAAPSQAAALKAWGTDHNLFARGVAELVTDAALTAAPLAEPGKVIKLLRGSAQEQMAAASGPDPGPAPGKQTMKPRKPPPPRPSRAALDEAEQALAAEEASQAKEVDALSREIEKLERTRRALIKTQEARRARLEAARDKAEADHQAALETWRRQSA